MAGSPLIRRRVHEPQRSQRTQGTVPGARPQTRPGAGGEISVPGRDSALVFLKTLWGKERPCPPPGHQERQGIENSLRSSASSAFRISTRRTQRNTEEKKDPVHHQDTKNTKEKRTLCVLCVSNFNAEDAKERGGKERPCSPPRQLEHQGKENPLRSSAFRISTRRTQRNAEDKKDPVHHQDTENAKEKETFPYYPAVSARISFAATPFCGT